jgi:glycosyltransferase involved in cell wall biosynthesis
VIAGPGLDTPFGATIKQMTAGDNQIYFPGMLSGNAKWGAFYGSEVFILPSHQENFGIAVVEALACGKPALISNQVNIWREIIEGNAGLAANDTEADTYKLIENWYLLPFDDKEKIVANTKATFTNYFTVNKAADNIMQLLNTNN